MSNNQNKSHWGSFFNWNMIKKFFSVGLILVVVYVIMIVLSPLMKLGKNVAQSWDAAWNVITKAFDGLCAKSGRCVAAPGQLKNNTTGTCNSVNPDTKGNQCDLTKQQAVDADKTKDASDGPCGSKWNGWCIFIPIGIAIMFLVGGPFALLGLIGKGIKNELTTIKEGGEYMCEQVSALTGRDVAKILRESTDGVEEYSEKDEEATDKILEGKYPKDANGKFTPEAIKNLAIKTKDGDLPLDPDSLQKRAQEQYDKLRKMQVDNLKFKRQRSIIIEKNKDLIGTNKIKWNRLIKQNGRDIKANQDAEIEEATEEADEAAAESARKDAEAIEEQAEIPKVEAI